jgi:hypothetical protein
MNAALAVFGGIGVALLCMAGYNKFVKPDRGGRIVAGRNSSG